MDHLLSNTVRVDVETESGTANPNHQVLLSVSKKVAIALSQTASDESVGVEEGLPVVGKAEVIGAQEARL